MTKCAGLRVGVVGCLLHHHMPTGGDRLQREWLHDKGISETAHAGEDLTRPPMSYRYGDVVAPYLAFNEPLMVEDEHFIDCVISGMTPLTGGANGLAVVEVLECAQRSAAEGRAVLVEEVHVPAAPLDGVVVSTGSPVIGELL